MKVTFHYGSAVLTLPAAVLEALPRASETDLRLLLALAGGDSAAVASIPATARDASLAFWRGAGILVSDDPTGLPEKAANGIPAPETGTAKKETLRSADALPEYTAEEVKTVFNGDPALAGLLDACQQTVGKVFNTAECGIVLGLRDHLALDAEYILTLLSYCVRKGKKSLRYLEKTALDLTDRGVDTPAALDLCLKQRELTDSLEGKLRTLFGMKERALSKKEKDCFSRWCGEWQFGFDGIQRAYELTVNATGQASVPYADAILSKWHAAGCHTAEEIDAYDKGDTRKKSRDSAGGKGGKSGADGNSSFDIDDFFEAALRRRYTPGKTDKAESPVNPGKTKENPESKEES